MSQIYVPVRITGSSRRWAFDFAVAGALTPLSHGLFFGFIDLHLVSIATVGALTGGAIGAVSPAFLDLVRRGVPLWLLTLLASLTWATQMMATFWSLGAIAIGAFIGAVFWLPYTIAVMTGRRTWPVVLGAVLVSPTIELFRIAHLLWQHPELSWVLF